MNEILNNLEKISNLLAENENFSIEDFTPISKLIAETEIKVIRLCEVVRQSEQLKEKEEINLEEFKNLSYAKIGGAYINKEKIVKEMNIDYHKHKPSD